MLERETFNSSRLSVQWVTNAMFENGFEATIVAGHCSYIRGNPCGIFYQPPIYCKASINDDLFEQDPLSTTVAFAKRMNDV